jgi:hypothetical protein
MNLAHPEGESMIPNHQENGHYFIGVSKFCQAWVFENIA